MTTDSRLVPLISSDDIKARLEGIVDEIRAAMPTRDLVVVALLKGSFMFLADLVRLLHRHEFSLEIEFMKLSSYGDGTESTGPPAVHLDIDTDITGRDVLIVDDILDSGRTLKKARELIAARGARCVQLCVLLDKPERRIEPICADMVGFTIPNHFVVGYGLDYAHRYRELPYIARLEPAPQ